MKLTQRDEPIFAAKRSFAIASAAMFLGLSPFSFLPSPSDALSFSSSFYSLHERCQSAECHLRRSSSPFMSPLSNDLSFYPVRHRELNTRLSSSSSSASSGPGDSETPDQRKARMEKVRRLERAFYKVEEKSDDAANSSSVEKKTSADGNVDNAYVSSSVIKNLPLWRVPWTELPGYQNVLNVHQIHYRHMFRTILAGPRPWVFGHLYLKGGTENLHNPEYALNGASSAELTGVLMTVVDHAEVEDDGRLILVVQATDRFRVVVPSEEEEYREKEDASSSPSRMPSSPLRYATATVELLHDDETLAYHRDRLFFFDSGKFDEDERRLKQAAHVASSAESIGWRPFEFRTVRVQDCLGGEGKVFPLSLSNFDKKATAFQSSRASDGLIDDAVEAYIEAKDRGDIDALSLLNGNATNLSGVNVLYQKKIIAVYEHNIWIESDRMIKLLVKIHPNRRIQNLLPPQLIGLVPLKSPLESNDEEGRQPWPEDFELLQYASVMSVTSANPFVHVDAVVEESRLDGDAGVSVYPDLRRKQRLSYAIWVLLEQIMDFSDGDAGGKLPMRQNILKMCSIEERFQAALTRITTINSVLEQILAKQKPKK